MTVEALICGRIVRGILNHISHPIREGVKMPMNMFDYPWHLRTPLSQVVEKARYIHTLNCLWGHHKVKFREIDRVLWRMPWNDNADNLMGLLIERGYDPKMYSLSYYNFHNPKGIDLVIYHNPRFGLGWYADDDYGGVLFLECIYRRVGYDKYRRFKARDMIKEFIALGQEAGFRQIKLELTPFGLHPRLPKRKVPDDPDNSPQMSTEELRKMYEKLGFRGGETMSLNLKQQSSTPE